RGDIAISPAARSAALESTVLAALVAKWWRDGGSRVGGGMLMARYGIVVLLALAAVTAMGAEPTVSGQPERSGGNPEKRQRRDAGQPGGDEARRGSFDIEAHRGGRGLRPENTLQSFANALTMGVNTLELDMGVTKDHVIVVSHERGLNPDLAR